MEHEVYKQNVNSHSVSEQRVMGLEMYLRGADLTKVQRKWTEDKVETG